MCKDQPRDPVTGRFLEGGGPPPKPFTKENAAEMARRKHAKDKERKAGRELLRMVLEMGPKDPKVLKGLIDAGYDPDEITNELAMHVSQVERAISTGDPKCYAAVVRAAGYEDGDTVNVNIQGSDDHRPVMVRFVDCGDDGCGK